MVKTPICDIDNIESDKGRTSFPFVLFVSVIRSHLKTDPLAFGKRLELLTSVENFSASADQPGLTPPGMCALTGAHKKRPAQMSRSFVVKKLVL